MPARRRAPAARTLSIGALLALAAVVAPSFAPPARAASSAAARRAIAGDDVAIHNLVGRLRVEPGAGPDVVAEITTSGRDAGRLRVEQGPLRGRATLRVVYPSDRIHVEGMNGFSSSTLRVRDDGTLDGKAGDGRMVTLSGGGGLAAAADIVVRVPRGKRVSIYWGLGTGEVENVDGDLLVHGAALDVSARAVKGSLRVEVGSGDVSVAGAGGATWIRTGSGGVTLRDVRGDGLEVGTGSGTIDVDGVETSRLELQTGSGDVRASRVRAPRASVGTGSGRVDLALDGDAEDLTLETGSGDVSLAVPGAFGATVHFETGSGDIDSDVPITIRSRDRHEIDGTIGDGNGRLSVETGSGAITIRRVRS